MSDKEDNPEDIQIDGTTIRRKTLEDYVPNEKNHNQGTERGSQMIEKSFNKYGAGRSLLADKHGKLIAGNQSQQAALEAGMKHVIEVETDGNTVVVVKRKDLDLDDVETMKAIELAYIDNRASEISYDLDVDRMAEDIELGVDFGLMYTPGELAFLLGNDVVYGDEEEAGAAAAPEDTHAILQEKWGTKLGQLWQIPSQHGGNHRILCGDCRKEADVKRLFDGEIAQIAVTSPPYGMRRAANAIESNAYGGIAEDDYVDWFDAVQQQTEAILIEGGSFFVNIKPNTIDGERVLYVFDLVLAMQRRWGWQFIDEHCWTKAGVPGKWKRRLKNGFEAIYEFGKAGSHFVFEPQRMGRRSDQVMTPGQAAEDLLSTGKHFNFSQEKHSGIALPSNQFEASGGRSVAHSAMYPVALPYRFMMIYANAGDIIYDPFLGSGSNIHAAERALRLSYGIELLPEHVAVILEEWSELGYEPQSVNDE
jgi:DNA modification methylase